MKRVLAVLLSSAVTASTIISGPQCALAATNIRVDNINIGIGSVFGSADEESSGVIQSFFKALFGLDQGAVDAFIEDKTKEDDSDKAEKTAINESDKDKVYQVALLQSLTLGQYDGVITVEDLKKHGDIGIGTYEGVNGEMIYLDGEMYQALGDGSVVIADESETVPFATVAYFDKDDEVKDVKVESLDEMKEKLNKIVKDNGSNQFYFIKAEGTYEDMQVRSELKQEKPYKTLDEALKTDQREFEYKDVDGTLVAIYFPEYFSTLNTPGWHFHFISDDKSMGGHVLDLSNFEGDIKVSEMNQFEMYCPDTDTFNDEDLSVDQSERIKSVEQDKQQ